MQKKNSKLSLTQLLSYRPLKDQEKPEISFSEEMALLPASAAASTLVAMVASRLQPSLCTTDAVEYVAAELELRPAQMQAAEYLLVLFAIKELGGGVNNGRLVVDAASPPPAKKKRLETVPTAAVVNDNWKHFGREPPNVEKQRRGPGVGGGMTKVHIWDLKQRPWIKQ
jgi:hypothetical protein